MSTPPHASKSTFMHVVECLIDLFALATGVVAYLLYYQPALFGEPVETRPFFDGTFVKLCSVHKIHFAIMYVIVPIIM